jgi:hypothetical protein
VSSLAKTETPSEQDVKRAAELKEWLVERIGELEIELGRLRDMQAIVDSVLRKSSFISANELRNIPAREKATSKEEISLPKQIQSPVSVSNQSEESRQLRRSKDGALMANAFITPEKAIIVPSSDVRVSQSTPPFTNFFVNRILKGYETKDKEQEQQGKLKHAEVLSFEITESEGYIDKVTVNNYRDKARLNEILSTANWALARMLEKK